MTAETITLLLLCATYIVWILSLPLFPTQDGPIHLYYVHVMQALFSAQPGNYADFYTIKHLLPPYSLYYYSLLALARLVPLLLADKLIVCLYFLSFVLGFRYLARAIGPGADRMTLLVTLFLLNWPLGMGFVNFCLSITFGLWAIGHWVRFVGRPRPGHRVVFILLTIIITLTHPVPLLFVLGFCALDLLIRLIQHRRQPSAQSLPPCFLSDLLLFFVAGSLLGYVKLFTSVKILRQTKQATSTLSTFIHSIHPLGFLSGDGWIARVYLGLLLVVLIGSLLLAALHWRAVRRDPARPTATLWLYLAIGFLATLPLVPHDLNGSHYFSDRLTIFAWILALLAASAYAPRRRFERPALILFVVLANLLILYLADRTIRPAANAIASVQGAAGKHHGEVGIVLRDQGAAYLTRPDQPVYLAYDPFLWAPVHSFRANDAILYNTPWLDLEIIPLGPKASLVSRPLSLTALEAPSLLVDELHESPATSSAVLAKVRFAIVDEGAVQSPTAIPPSLQHDQPGDQPWRCIAATGSWYKTCDREPATP